jgi:DNA-directed RNA polymerase specialized sigma24 family protein
MKETAVHETMETFETTETEPTPEMQRANQLDELAMHACDGDRAAIGAIAVIVGPRLLREVRLALGEYRDEAEDVLQDLYLCLLDKMSPVRPARGDAVRYLCAVVRTLARQKRRKRARDWGDWEEEG